MCPRVAAMRVFARLLVARHGPPIRLHAGFLQSKPFGPLLVLGLSAGYPPRRISQPRVCAPPFPYVALCLSVCLSVSLSLSLSSRNVQAVVHSDPNFGPCSSPWSGNL
jgi:hypothetical protein